MIAAVALPVIASPTDTFRCEALSCVLARSACVARQDARRKSSARTFPAYRMCGPDKAGEPSPCAQGREVRAQLGSPEAKTTLVSPADFQALSKKRPTPKPEPRPSIDEVAAAVEATRATLDREAATLPAESLAANNHARRTLGIPEVAPATDSTSDRRSTRAEKQMATRAKRSGRAARERGKGRAASKSRRRPASLVERFLEMCRVVMERAAKESDREWRWTR